MAYRLTIDRAAGKALDALDAGAYRERAHMTEKPQALLEELVRLVPAGGAVCDPFVGSGTTGAAARATRLSFIGVEWGSEYWKVAAGRLARQ